MSSPGVATPETGAIQQFAFAPANAANTFDLTFNGQTMGTALTKDATAAQVQKQLQALSTIGSVDVERFDTTRW